MIKINTEVEISYHYDRSDKNEASLMVETFTYVCKETTLHTQFNSERLLIRGDVDDVSEINKRIKSIITGK